jgi:hypothetical protein
MLALSSSQLDPKLPSYRSLNLSGNVRAIEERMGCMDDPAEDAKWSVLLLNDDITPMEFVVYVIERIFDMDRESAMQLMRPHTRKFLHREREALARHLPRFS